MPSAGDTALGTRPPRRRQQEILDTAARVFHEKGYEATSIQDIADLVGILKGSLYYYIDSKEDLLYEIIRSSQEDAVATMADALAFEGDALEKIRAFVVAHVTFLAENLVRVSVFFHALRSLGEERRAEILAVRDAYYRQLRSLIEQGKKEGTIRAEADPEVAALAAIGTMNWLYQWYEPGGKKSVRQIAQGFADMIVYGLSGPPR
jgi:AcrR family transcriptional regulator